MERKEDFKVSKRRMGEFYGCRESAFSLKQSFRKKLYTGLSGGRTRPSLGALTSLALGTSAASVSCL